MDMEEKDRNNELSRKEIEKRLVEIWKEVLGAETVGIHDNFFTLGGDSIKAMEILSKTKDEVGNIKLSELYLYQTIAEIADYIVKVDKSKEQDKRSSLSGGSVTEAEKNEIMDLFD